MYEDFYNFSGKPFQLSPDHRFFFESDGHKRAMSYLLYGIKAGEGFIVVTGDIGTGKTTLVNALSDSLENKHIVTAKIVTTQIQEDDLLRVVAAEYGLPYENVSKAVLLRNLELFFKQLAQEGKRALLLVDEAQNLPPRSIEELRMLSNFQLQGRALLQSFLLGQREFRATMRLPQFEQLRQRVIAAYHLKPMTLEETRGYVLHRLKLVGWSGDPVLTDETFDGIFENTQGIPRKINVFCDRLFLCASLEESHEVNAEILSMVQGDLGEESWADNDPEGEVNPAETLNPAAQGLEALQKQALASLVGSNSMPQEQLLSAISEMMDKKLEAFNATTKPQKTGSDQTPQLVSVEKKETRTSSEQESAATKIDGFYPSSNGQDSA